MRVAHGTALDLVKRRRTPLEDVYQLFRLEKQGNRVSAATLKGYEFHVGGLLRWLERERPDVRRPEDLTVDILRTYRAEQATRLSVRGKPLTAETLQGSHGHIRAFLHWSENEGYALDPRVLKLPRIRVPAKEPTVFHMTQLRQILAACNPAAPQQEMVVRILVGSGVRVSELCGLAVEAPDGLSDVMLDSLDRGRAELRIRGEAGAKGHKSRRVPINTKLAAAIKRYEARHRPDGSPPALLVNLRGATYHRPGIDTLLDRLQLRVGFRVHAHAFRHTFATVATQLGWNFERLRAAMGHRRLQHAPEVRTPGHGAGSGPDGGLGGLHPHSGGDGAGARLARLSDQGVRQMRVRKSRGSATAISSSGRQNFKALAKDCDAAHKHC